MFRKHADHLQPPLLSDYGEVAEKHRQRLENSWAGVFYKQVFSQINEDIFSVLYTDTPSRPNTPVNVLVGLECLKAGFNWSDEELYDAFIYNLQVRYALGYYEFGQGDFHIRTLYNFRERLNRHRAETGENLLNQAFEQITGKQIEAFQLKTGMQRMDTTQISSNIHEWGRLELLVEILQRVYRMLSEKEQTRYAQAFGPYVKQSASHYLQYLKKEQYPAHLQAVGELMRQLLSELKKKYPQHETYQILERVFHEHFKVEAETVQILGIQELSASRLLSPDDQDATLRARRNTVYRGYAANLTETCDPQNPFQLVTKVQVAANVVDDPKLALEALPDLKERTQLEKLYTDGGFGSSELDQAVAQKQVEHVPTGIRGARPNPNKLNLGDFEFRMNQEHLPHHLKCPQGQVGRVRMGAHKKTFTTHFDPAVCSSCPFDQNGQCPAKPEGVRAQRKLHFSQKELQVALRRKRVQSLSPEEHNLRSAIEATCRAIKCRYPKGKFPVRGLFRMSCLVIGSAVVYNVRRITRYLMRSGEIEPQIAGLS